MKKFLSVVTFLVAMTISIAAFAASSSSGPVAIIWDTCTECGICVSACPTGSIIPGSPYQVNYETCIGCGACMDTCPEGAIWLAEVS